MNLFFESIYSLAINFYFLFIRLASLFSPKAKEWIKGRKNWAQQTEQFVSKNGSPDLWIHVASAGEFEQARTIIDGYKKKHPLKKILLTFFSPSGYNLRKNYPNVDGVLYLPLDTKSNAKILVEIIKPRCVLFVKYDYWYYVLKELKSHNIPTILVSAVFRQNQIFWQWWGRPMQACLNFFFLIFTQNEESLNILLKNDYTNAVLSGDTRFDRVAELALEGRDIKNLKKVIEGRKVIIAGSTWSKDEGLLSQLYAEKLDNDQYVLIIAPHEITSVHLNNLSRVFPKGVHYSQLTANASTNIIIIDNIGMLSYLYRYATLTYIGGGFGKGIHNILEPAVFGKPVVFGPRYEKFYEAKELILTGGAFSITSYEDFRKIFDKMSDMPAYKNASIVCKQYVKERTGATKQILNWLDQIPSKH